MPVSCSLFQIQSAGVLVCYPSHVGPILDFTFRVRATAHKSKIHGSPIGGRLVPSCLSSSSADLADASSCWRAAR
jgi:hypothetical protein